jgi:hypothetical protein
MPGRGMGFGTSEVSLPDGGPQGGPFTDELEGPGLQTAGQHLPVRRDWGTAARMIGVERATG